MDLYLKRKETYFLLDISRMNETKLNVIYRFHSFIW